MRIRSTLAVFATSVAIVASAIAALPEASAAPGATGGPGYLTGTYYPNLIEFVGTQVPGTVPASAAVTGQSETLVSEATISSRHIERPDADRFKSTSTASTLPSATSLSVVNSSGRSWRALGSFDDRYADNGNQYTVEPSDMAMCTSGQFITQLVNDAVQIYSASGTAQLAGTYGGLGAGYTGAKAFSFNQFFGYPHEYDRGAGEYGPSLYDPTCLYDAASQRWFLITDALDSTPGGDYTGDGWIDIMVSKTIDPRGAYWHYRLWLTNDGNHGTPDHNCDSGTGGSQCFGDYPQIGLDANGLYISTNEFNWWGSGDFRAAQLYAIDKGDLASGDSSPYSSYFENVPSSGSLPGYGAYTLQPVNGLPAQMVANSMYFGHSWAPWVDAPTNQFSVYRLSGTNNLSTATLQESVVTSGISYIYPPDGAVQRSGNTPNLDDYNKGNSYPGFPHIAPPIPLATGGSGKFMGAWISRGYLFFTAAVGVYGSGGAEFGSAGTWKAIDARTAAAIFSVRVSPAVAASTTFARAVSVRGQNLLYPSVAVNANGKGAIGATLVGPSYYPSAVFVPITVGNTGSISFGSVNVARAGAGPNDGFTGFYPYYWRTRWGDYGTAVVDPGSGSIWMASGYIAQTCTSSEWSVDPTCGYTRTYLANWSSAIYKYIP